MKKILLIVIVFTSFGSHLVAQNLTIQKLLADSLFQSEEYFDAITEYKRLLFFAKNEECKFEVYSKIGLCYKAGGKYDDAIKYFGLAKHSAKMFDDSLKANLQIIRTNILRRTIPQALSLLEKLKRENYNKIDTSIINYWTAWAHLMNDNWDLAANEFDKNTQFHHLKTFADSINSAKYSWEFAKFISIILPGSGQFYTGNYLSGFLSLAWNVFGGYLTINAFATDRALEGVLFGSLVWTRFYRGNFQNAEKFAIEKNSEISNNAYKILSQKFLDEKP